MAQVVRYVRSCSSSAAQTAERLVTKAVRSGGLLDDTSCLVAWLGAPPLAFSMRSLPENACEKDVSQFRYVGR